MFLHIFVSRKVHFLTHDKSASFGHVYRMKSWVHFFKSRSFISAEDNDNFPYQ